jgi:hypothetical protein
MADEDVINDNVAVASAMPAGGPFPPIIVVSLSDENCDGDETVGRLALSRYCLPAQALGEKEAMLQINSSARPWVWLESANETELRNRA